MPRWEPDAQLRLETAALELFAERGYDGTTVADIAERAGLMKRSFFRYFPDKREALFGGGTERLVAHLRQEVEEAPADTPPWRVLIAALTSSGRFFPADRAVAHRRQSVIAANPELREREVLKMATLHDLLTSLLVKRGIPERQAVYLVRLAQTVYEQAFARWIDPGTDRTFEGCMVDAAAELDRALARGMVGARGGG
ncbi:TetR family transcriptional regulator [Streptomyces rugosispiralis]|uniref:TetR/AcrR family transcriptional regulator n=1 Tax=Streptomyces rugosispiralis TaxID=2967341 RepID=A0ABT1UWT3_9ACTN|nr:TetR family transcriptional regulator [Streptomyces rugosispiralis]MCQ8189579.1 TetR/AcrR family transcriptional regulator [Streptomyces rugosispiralis]